MFMAHSYQTSLLQDVRAGSKSANRPEAIRTFPPLIAAVSTLFSYTNYLLLFARRSFGGYRWQ